MKKNNFKLIGLSLILVLLGMVMISDNSNAANVADIPVTLAITAGNVDCFNSTGFGAMSGVVSSFTAQAQTGYAGANSWYCNDTRGNNLRVNTGLKVMMTAPLSGLLGGSIPNANIKMYAAAPTLANNSTPACTAAGDLTTVGGININNTNLYVLRKTGVAGSICKIQTTPIIYIAIPASQPVDTYTGTITVTAPTP